MVLFSLSGWGYWVPMCILIALNACMCYVQVLMHQKKRQKAQKQQLSNWECLIKSDMAILDLWFALAWVFGYGVFRLRPLFPEDAPHQPPPPPPAAADDNNNNDLLVLSFALEFSAWMAFGYLSLRAFRFWWYAIDADDVESNQPSVLKRESFWYGILDTFFLGFGLSKDEKKEYMLLPDF